jgi:hypothetical protein
MRFKLEDEIGHVDTEQEYSSAAGYDQKAPFGHLRRDQGITDIVVSLWPPRCPLDRRSDVLRGVIRCWNYKGCSL